MLFRFSFDHAYFAVGFDIGLAHGFEIVRPLAAQITQQLFLRYHFLLHIFALQFSVFDEQFGFRMKHSVQKREMKTQPIKRITPENNRAD